MSAAWVLLLVVLVKNSAGAVVGITSQTMYFTDEAHCDTARDTFAKGIMTSVEGTGGYAGCRPTGDEGPPPLR